jgi:hypothetical protein
MKMKYKDILLLKDIEAEKPNCGDLIIGITTVGAMKGSYISGNTFQTKSGLFTFTKWKLQESKAPNKK